LDHVSNFFRILFKGEGIIDTDQDSGGRPHSSYGWGGGAFGHNGLELDEPHGEILATLSHRELSQLLKLVGLQER